MRMTDSKLPYADVKFCVNGNMRMFSRMLTQYYDAAIAPAGILFTQFMVLAVIANMNETTINPLADALMMDRTTLTRALKPLQRDGLVESFNAEDDARKRLVRLTEAGQNVLNNAYPLWKQTQTTVMNNLGDERWMQIFEDMHQLLSELQNDDTN